MPEEWLPGYVPAGVEKRPKLEQTPHYPVQALTFDPDQHHVW
jgi:hypothetical protein